MAKNVKSKKKRRAEEVAPRPHPRTEIMDIAKIAVPTVITVTVLFINAYSVFKPASCAIEIHGGSDITFQNMYVGKYPCVVATNDFSHGRFLDFFAPR
jgi:hypothetical protein